MSYTPPQQTSVDFDLEDAPNPALDEVAFDLAIGAPAELTTTVVDTGSGAAVDLTWRDDSDNEDGTRIYRSAATSPSFPGDYTAVGEAGADVESFQDDTVDYQTDYTYRAVAFVSGGAESDPSGEATATIGQGPTFEVQITATNSPVEAGETLTVDVDVVNVGDFDGEKDVALLVEEQ